MAGGGILHGFRQKIFGFELSGQDGFFEASLLTAFPRTSFVHLREVFTQPASFFRSFDWILINRKAVVLSDFDRLIVNQLLPKLEDRHVALVVNNDDEYALPPETLLHRFDLIFKRECLLDKGAYGVSNKTTRKLRTTMISCPFVRVFKTPWKLKIHHAKFPQGYAREASADVSFVGANTNIERREILTVIHRSKLKFCGGLYDHSQKELPLDWDGPKSPQLRVQDYVSLIRKSKVNLALAGHGGFTYRHLELWYLGAFMLSEPQIRNISLPGEQQPIDGVHYVAFDSPSDLIDKARYYAENDEQRTRIAMEGQKFF
jgi:hypothetical protein